MHSIRRMGRTVTALLVLAGALHGLARAGQAETPTLLIDEGKIYRKASEETISGKEILDLMAEQKWDKDLEDFAAYVLRIEEAQTAGIAVSESEIEAELQYLLDAYARKINVDPKEIKIEALAKQYNLAGGLAALRQQTRANLGMLRVLQKEGKLAAGAHTNDKTFEAALNERLEKRVAEKGVVRDSKQLGSGEAIRIGTRSYARDEVRRFIVERLGPVAVEDLKIALDFLQLEKLVQRVLNEKKIAVADDDLSFYFSFFCRKREAETGIPGRIVARQDLAASGLTPEDFVRSRAFKLEAAIVRLARDKVGNKQLKDEFAAHPERYKVSENLVAHIFVRVLDPDGKPYLPNWRAPGHGPVNAFVARKRDEQFEAARPKIDGMLEMAKQNFEDTARKFSDDKPTAAVGGTVGRMGAQTIPMPPCDSAVRDAAIRLKPGELSAPVRSDYGWHLLKCLDKQEVTFDEAAERVYVNLIQEGKLKFIEALTKDVRPEDKF